ncbi:MAG TPA: TIGR03089 family protein [Propionibacteriaceae bacterium]|nr:TIGR03089 family protein [Propionibacteriaceae bacterium]
MIADQLRRRVRSGGAAPLLTYYDLGTGERTELSATGFLNWVDKTSNLLVDEYLLEPGAVIDLELARSAPGHWVSLVVTMAGWQVGATIRVGVTEGPPADLLVLGPHWRDADLQHADAVLACSLHPLGMGFAEPLPSPLADFSVEVRGQPDQHSATPRAGAEPAWVDAHRRLTQSDLVSLDAVAAGSGASGAGLPAARRLVMVSEPWSSTRDGLVVPLMSGGSAVLVRGDDPERLTRIGHDERVER